MAEAKRDNNGVPTLIGVSSSDGTTPITIYVDPVTHRVLTSLAAGGGTVTEVSVVTAQGVSGAVANATTTPAITLTFGAMTGVTSFNGLVVTANTGFITTGTWNASVIGPAYGGTGVANNAANTLTYSGNFALTLTLSGATGITLPTSGTIATLAGTETLSGKTLTAPRFVDAGFIADDSGNELLVFGKAASAVNEIKISNAATGTTGPLIEATGETNIDLRISAKGTGKIVMLKQVNFGAFTAYFTETDNGNSGTSDTIDWGVGNKQRSTLTGNVTFTFTAPPGPCNLILKLIQDATGSRTVTWPATVHWSGGVAPTLTTTANRVDIISLYFDGTTYFGTSSLNYVA